MPERDEMSASCALCSAVQAKTGKTSCSTSGTDSGPRRPRNCPTETEPEVIGAALHELRGDGDDARTARIAAQVEGLGYDTLFNKHASAPVSTLVVKDRVTGHNPASVLYGRHYYRRLRTPLAIVTRDDVRGA